MVEEVLRFEHLLPANVVLGLVEEFALKLGTDMGQEQRSAVCSTAADAAAHVGIAQRKLLARGALRWKDTAADNAVVHFQTLHTPQSLTALVFWADVRSMTEAELLYPVERLHRPPLQDQFL